MRSLRFTPAANADMVGIWRYSAANWGAAQADRYVLNLREISERIAKGVVVGRRTLRPGLYKTRSGSHMIYYRVTSDHLEIIRVLHAKQDVDRHL